MKRTALGLMVALLVHVAVILFGGLLFQKPDGPEKKTRVAEVDLIAPEDPAKSKDRQEPKKDEAEEAEAKQNETPLQEDNTVPDLQELAKLDQPGSTTPALDSLSLSAMEDLMNPNAGGAPGFPSQAADFTSGGRIGGTGKGTAENPVDVFSMAELDQKPRPLVQGPPSYPQDLRRKKVEGSVYVYFVVDEQGRVTDSRIEKSSNAEFDTAALAAVRQWKFEPAVKEGQKVKCKMRVPLRFSLG